ncbi:hypothetical protein GGH94_003049 [Coemansia aciculifera]|uniref:F-box domain-containing protein n=1 Tax=Coemansia aciculifera TaxID=417176 RepID=A0A9W8IHT0_9FUNG|nr:hypothetical protein GGH94_003049 [Coemansia aciculifera]
MPKTKLVSSRKKPQKAQKMPKLRKMQKQPSAPTSTADAPSDVLQLIYDYLSPTPPRCASLLPNHMRTLQRLAGVNRQWRAVAMPQLYQAVVVDVDEPTKKQRTHSDGNKLWTNIGLIVGADMVRMAREVWITVRGSGQTSLRLSKRLRSAGLGDTVWSGVDGKKSLDPLNELLSAALPSLREISFLGPGASKVYHCIPIYQLISEHLGRPQRLQALLITSDSHPELMSHSSRLSTPIRLTCLDINTIEMVKGAPLRLPPLLASSLVELRLGAIYFRKVWEPFVAPFKRDLVFSSLKSLTLCFLMRREIQPRNHNAIKFAMDSEDEDWWPEEYDGYNTPEGPDPCPEIDTPGYLESTKLGTPKLLVLTSLEIRRFPGSLNYFLTLFEPSPITTLSLWSLKHRITVEMDLTLFRELRSLSVRFLDAIDGVDEERIGIALPYMFRTVNPKLQALTLMMHIYEPFKLELGTPSFADNLTSLTLEGHIVLDHVIALLPLLTNLQRLNLFASVTDSVPAAAFMGKYKQEIAPHLLPPLSISLHCVRAENLQKFAEEAFWTIYTDIPRTAAEEVSLYRHLILDLVCRFPSFQTLMVSAASIEGVRKSINMLAKSGVGPEHMSRMRCVEIPVTDEFHLGLGRD